MFMYLNITIIWQQDTFFLGGGRSVGTDLQVTFGRDNCDCYCKVRQREDTFALKLLFCFCQS